ncbi:MAG: hypothetical protein AAFQ24_03610 [Pseudomonadota bacterium]
MGYGKRERDHLMKFLRYTCVFTISLMGLQAFPQSLFKTCGDTTKLSAGIFDADGDGDLNDAEQTAYVRNRDVPGFCFIDTDRDGQISLDEIQSYLTLADEQTAPTLVDLADQFPNGDPVRVVEVDRDYRARSPKSPISPVLIRRSLSDMSPLEHDGSVLLSSPVPRSKAKGAFLSYSKDIEANTEVWQARGAIGYPILVTNTGTAGTEQKSVFSGWALSPAVVFDRSSSSDDEAKEVDKLEFSLVSEWEWSGGFIDSQFFRLMPSYTLRQKPQDRLEENPGMGAARSTS